MINDRHLLGVLASVALTSAFRTRPMVVDVSADPIGPEPKAKPAPRTAQPRKLTATDILRLERAAAKRARKGLLLRAAAAKGAIAS